MPMRPNFITRPPWLAATALVFALGCSDVEKPSVDGWTIDDPADTPTAIDTPATNPTNPTIPPAVDRPVVPSTPTRLDCTLEASHLSETWWVEPQFHEFVPNEGLFVSGAGLNGDAVSLSVSDGHAFGTNDVEGLRSVDRNWTVGMIVGYPNATIVEMSTREVLSTIEGPVTAAAIAPDGAQAAVMVCDAETTELVLLNLDEGTQRRSVIDREGSCYTWTNTMHRLDFTDDGELLAYSSIDGSLWSIRTDSLAATRIKPYTMPEDVFYDTTISDMAIRPGSHEVAVTALDGMLRRWSLDDLTEIGEPVEVGRFRINEQTYAPQYTVSPIAFSPDGHTIAYVDVDGNVVVSNEGGVSVLQSPPVPEEFTDWGRTENVPVTLTFGPSGERVGVGYYWGPAVWGCPGGAITRDGTLRLEVPSVVEAEPGGRVSIPLTLTGAGPLTAIRVAIGDTDLQWYLMEEGQIIIWVDPTNAQDVVIEADDGLARDAATVQVRFIQ